VIGPVGQKDRDEAIDLHIYHTLSAIFYTFSAHNYSNPEVMVIMFGNSKHTGTGLPDMQKILLRLING
jgi:hypothetical protein